MATVKRYFRKKTTIVTSLILAVLIFIGVKKGIEYASAPTKDTDCNFIYPEAIDQTKPATIIRKQSEAPFTFE